MPFQGSHILSVTQFTLADVEHLFAVAARLEPYASRRRVTRVLEGAVLGNLFFEPSTRTRISFGVAFDRLGGAVRDTAGFDVTSIVKGESLYDTARVVGGYVDVVVVRHPRQGAVAEFAEAVNIPVINAGDGPGEHPTQALLDLYTVGKELRRGLRDLKGLTVAFVGDLKFGRTVHSFVKLLAILEGIEIRCVAPAELPIPDEVVQYATSRGHRVVQTQDLRAGLAGADVVYVTRVQEERFSDPGLYQRLRGAYAIDAATVRAACKPGVVLLHPLPRDTRPGAGNELSNDLNGSPNLAIFRQADNGIPVRMALFAVVLGIEDRIGRDDREVTWFVPPQVGRVDP